MTIVSIDAIKAGAEKSAQSKQSKSEVCPFPATSPEGRKWSEFYDAAKTGFNAQVAEYGAAIGIEA
jgi:hypothetical protein